MEIDGLRLVFFLLESILTGHVARGTRIRPLYISKALRNVWRPYNKSFACGHDIIILTCGSLFLPSPDTIFKISFKSKLPPSSSI